MNNYDGVISIKTKEWLFILLFSLYSFISILSRTFYAEYFISFYKYIVVVIIGGLGAIEILYGQFSKRSLVTILICVIAVIIVLVRNNSTKNFEMVLIFVFCARGLSFEKIAKASVIVCSTVLALTIFSAEVGIIENYTSVYKGRVREYLGFLYVLYPSMIMYNIILLSLWLLRKSSKFKSILVCAFLALINYYLFSRTDSRLTFYMSLVSIGIFIIIKFVGAETKCAKPIGYIFPLICVLAFGISYLVCSRYSPEVNWMYELNDVLERRLELAHKALNTYGVKLFGSNVKWIGNALSEEGINDSFYVEYNYVDNYYIQILVEYGLVGIVLLLFSIIYATVRTVQHKSTILMFILGMLALHGFIDDLPLYIYFNTFWLVLSAKINDDEYKLVEIENYDENSYNVL